MDPIELAADRVGRLRGALATAWHIHGEQLANAIDRAGHRSSSRVVLVALPTSEAFVLSALATWSMGYVGSPGGSLTTADECAAIVDQLRPRALVRVASDTRFAAVETSVLQEFEIGGLSIALSGVVPEPEPVALASTDAWLAATSGSTGPPKYAILGAAALLHNAAEVARMQELCHDDTVCVFTPANFSYALNQAGAAVHAGATLLLWPYGLSSTNALWKYFQDNHVTAISASPTAFELLLRRSRGQPNELVRSVVVGGQALSVNLLGRLWERFPSATICNAYGATENVNRISFWKIRPEDFVPATTRLHVGVAIEGTEVHVDSAPGASAGEVVLSGQSLMRGYLGEVGPNDTIQQFRTGDVGELDPDGNLRLIGRLKTAINVGGENFSPEEVEAITAEVDFVQECAAGGLRDELLGEVPVAVVSVNAGVVPTEVERELQNIWQAQLSPSKRPRRVAIVRLGSIPRTNYGKIDRSGLAEFLAATFRAPQG